MSQLGLFYLISVSKLAELNDQPAPTVVKKRFRQKFINPSYDYLQQNATALEVNPQHLGGILINIQLYLQAKGIDLQGGQYKAFAEAISAKQQTVTFILTHEHKKQFNQLIDIDALTDDECRATNSEYEGDDSDEQVEYFREGLYVLKNALAHITGDDSVVIFEIA